MQKIYSYSLILALVGGCAAASPAFAESCGLNVNPGKLDSNHNAELSRDETRGTALEPVFDIVDQDNNGIISQVEYAQRCGMIDQANAAKKTRSRSQGDSQASEPAQAKADASEKKSSDSSDSGWGDSVVGKKAKRQTDRQERHVEDRVDKETDKATDKAVDKALDSLFGH